MTNALWKRIAVAATLATSWVDWACASANISITLPRRSRLSIVQRLNRDGVEAVRKHDYGRADSLFLRAYLYDPSDPFTLNNLGYISEVMGQLERAHRFYQLAAEQGCNAAIDVSSAKQLQGKPMMAAIDSLEDLPMRVNRLNVEAMWLLSNRRNAEALATLQQALQFDRQNPFTLNNLGVAYEAVGDDAKALDDYRAAAMADSSQVAVITFTKSWTGKPVSELAAASVRRLESRMRGGGSEEAKATLFNLRGVVEENQNNWSTAREDFLRAYSLDPSDAFSLNNRGYVAERDGDLESAQYFYDKARKAAGVNARVGLATQRAAEGKPLLTVTSDSSQKVDGALAEYSIERRRQQGPIELTPRGSGHEAIAPERRTPASARTPSSNP